MKNDDELNSMIKKINSQTDDIEKMMKLLLINNIVDEAENLITINQSNSIDKKIEEIVKKFKMKLGRFDCVGDLKVLNIDIPRNVRVTVKDLEQTYNTIKNVYPDIEPVFNYQLINGMQRKKLLQNNVSFSVKGKEIHVCSSKGGKGWI